MSENKYAFNKKHMHNIKEIFEDKTGVQLENKRPALPRRRLVAVVIAVILCITAATPVLAANVSGIYEIMYLVSPSVAQFFKPVQQSSEYEGIEMEVVSSYIHENIAEIYVTLQDLKDDRIDATTDLYDSYSINRSFDSSATCESIGYDEETKTKTFLITVTEWGNHDIEGEKITFSARELLSNKIYYNDIEIPIDMMAIATAIDTQQVYSYGGGGLSYPKNAEYITALIPEENVEEFPIDGINMTGVGYIDGQLHIQTEIPDRLNNDNHGYFYLKDISNNKIESSYSFYFSNSSEQIESIDYCEYVFDVPIEAIDGYLLYGDFVISGQNIKGFWSVTFPLQQGE